MAKSDRSPEALEDGHAALLAERAFLEAILHAQRDTVFVLDLTTGRPVRWNSAFEKISGYSPEEISTLKAPDSYYSSEDLVRASQVIASALNGGTGSVELALICKDGRRVPTEYSVSGLEGEDGAPRYLVSIGRDVTNQKAAQAELSEALEIVSREKELINDVVNALPGIFYVLDFESVFQHWNVSFQEATGLSSEELAATNALELFEEEDQRAISTGIRRVVEVGEAMVEAQLLHRGGGKTPYLFSGRRVEIEGETRVVGLGLDITQRKQAEADLALHGQIMSHMREAVYLIRVRDGIIVYSNPEFDSLFGYGPGEMLGRHVSVVNAPTEQSPEEIAGEIMAEIERDGSWTGEVENIRKDGSRFWSSARVSTFDHPTHGTALLSVHADITSEREAQLALAAERDRAQRYLDVAGVMLVALDVEGRVTLINKRGCEILGYAGSEEVVGKDWFDLVLPEEEFPTVKGAFTQLLSGEIEPLEYYENAVRTKDGRERTIAWHNALLRDADGKVIGTLSSGEDITDRMLVERELMSSKAFVESVVQASPGLIYIYDLAEHRNVFASEEITDLLGYSPVEIKEVGDQVSPMLIHPEDLPKVGEHHLQLEGAEDGEVRALEYRMRHRDGRWRWLRSVDTPFLRSDSGGVKQIVGICEDYSVRREAFEGLRRFEEVVSSSTDLLALLDRDYRYLVANRAYHDAFQMAPGEIIGKTVEEVFGREFFGSVIKPFADRSMEGEVVSYEKWFDLPGQGRRFLGVSYSPYRVFKSDEVMGFVVSAKDLTDLKHSTDVVRSLNMELEQRVQERTAQLAASNRELESFSYSVSHDLRAPLRAIDGFSRALEEDCSGQLDQQGVGYIARVRAGTQRMGDLIDDLLHLSRASRGDMSIGEVDLSEMAARILVEIREQNPPRHVDTVIAPGLKVRADPRLLSTALENLLRNAWKFTSHHDQAQIEVGVEMEGGKKWFFVRDDGAGFDMEFSDKLFQAFQRLHRPEDFPGSGIGLATVQRVVQRHGGSVRATGGVEKGATFYLHLPGKAEMGEGSSDE